MFEVRLFDQSGNMTICKRFYDEDEAEAFFNTNMWSVATAELWGKYCGVWQMDARASGRISVEAGRQYYVTPCNRWEMEHEMLTYEEAIQRYKDLLKMYERGFIDHPEIHQRVNSTERV